MKKLLGFAFLAGLIFGVIETWNWLRYRNPVEVTLASNAVSELPKHVRLKNVFLSPTDVASTHGLGGKYLYIPIRSLGDKAPAPTLHFVLKTNEPALLNAMTQAKAAKGLSAALVALQPLLSKNEVSGMVGDGDLTQKQRGQLRSQFPKLAEDFSLIEDGRHPSLFTALFFFAMGAGAIVISGLIYRDPVVPVPAVKPPVITPAQ